MPAALSSFDLDRFAECRGALSEAAPERAVRERVGALRELADARLNRSAVGGIARLAGALLAGFALFAEARPASGREAVNACARQVDAALDGVVPAAARLRDRVVELKAALGASAYREACRAGVELLAQPELAEGRSLGDVLSVLGRPDLLYAEADGASAQLYYETGGGSLDLAFRDCSLVHASLDTPAHWGGSDAELAALWSKARRSREWWLWQPMTGTLSPVEGPSGDDRRTRSFEVDLDGGLYGDTGALSFALSDGLGCRGRWSAAAGGGLEVTRGRLLAQYGSTYFPGAVVPRAPEPYQRLGHAFIECDGGRSMRLEFLTGPGSAHGWGIAQDDRGALYRFTF